MIENQYLLEYVGETKTQKLLDEIQTNYFEMFKRKFPRFFETNLVKAGSFVTVTDDDEIKSIGHSCYDDLLLDNFGKLLGLMFTASSGITAGTGGGQFIAQGGGGLIQVNGYQTANTNKFNGVSNGAVGTEMRVGSGTTPATRQDFNIETPFLVAPLNANIGVAGDGGYNSGLGKITVSMNAIANENGTLSETLLLQIVSAFSPQSGLHRICLSHDNISPAVSFVNGQSINVDYGILLS